MTDERDETMERIRAALKPLPPTDAGAVARVLSAVHGRSPQPLPRWRDWLDWWRLPSLSMAGATGLVAVALIAGYVVKGQLSAPRDDSGEAVVAAVSDGAASSVYDKAVSSANAGGGSSVDGVIPAATTADAERAIATQFVLDLPDAVTVSIVGDFNSWAVGSAPMQKAANGVWSVTLPIKPGRHEYAFVVDSKRWMADPRAPQASNSDDFGKPGSVIVVTPP